MKTGWMTDEDLQELTGKKRWSAQARWLEAAFRIEPLRRGDGRVMMTWETYRALEAKKAGVGSAEVVPLTPTARPVLRKVTFAGRAA
ncbi:DUF4224 domain-containing protein [Cupriavidus campinensis]|uniref:DUF4224 domain-containing protein n=1 Tax=Cupriavidus campinensis TaxID=151783 RepID=A0AAE9KZN8_9BURK|nr:DUF4224 domain-containing protein [Cupriavidus campinensis]URF03012.1 DUF4224 domain-containing protein [Cupriavidus campinensis]